MKIFYLLLLVSLAACTQQKTKIVYFTPEDVQAITTTCTSVGGYIERTNTAAGYPDRIICAAAPPNAELEK